MLHRAVTINSITRWTGIFGGLKTKLGIPITSINNYIVNRNVCTTAADAKQQIGDNSVILNKFGLEQKTIVQQEAVVRSYCRCWLSSTFPQCDGTHKKHNLETGDTVGPLVVQIPKFQP